MKNLAERQDILLKGNNMLQKQSLQDSFGRTLDYLRISVTDRCNLRCLYCMPPEGVKYIPHENILSFEEILRIIKIMTGLGIKNIKVTGGEPLLRKGTSAFLKQLKTISGIESVTLTTNGILLGEYLDVNDCLPDSINISIDALNCERYKHITRSNNENINKILSLIDFLLEKNITVKINCVPIRSVNENEIIPLVSLAKNKNIIVRFIELMPLGTASNLQFIPAKDVMSLIEKEFGLISPYEGIKSNGPAVYYSLPNFKGKIGLINAVSHGFCDTCNRLRLTSEGFLKLCLSSDLGLDLRGLIRSSKNISDEEISFAITKIVNQKPKFHSLSDKYGKLERHAKGMFEIGG